MLTGVWTGNFPILIQCLDLISCFPQNIGLSKYSPNSTNLKTQVIHNNMFSSLWHCGVMVITTVQHSTKTKPRFWAGSNTGLNLLVVCNGENLSQCFQLDIRVGKASTVLEKQFFVIMLFSWKDKQRNQEHIYFSIQIISSASFNANTVNGDVWKK